MISFIGNQAGGRVFLFLGIDDFWRDYNDMVSKGIEQNNPKLLDGEINGFMAFAFTAEACNQYMDKY